MATHVTVWSQEAVKQHGKQRIHDIISVILLWDESESTPEILSASPHAEKRCSCLISLCKEPNERLGNDDKTGEMKHQKILPATSKSILKTLLRCCMLFTRVLRLYCCELINANHFLCVLNLGLNSSAWSSIKATSVLTSSSSFQWCILIPWGLFRPFFFKSKHPVSCSVSWFGAGGCAPATPEGLERGV